MKLHRYNVLGLAVESQLTLSAAEAESPSRFRIRIAGGKPPCALPGSPLARRDAGAASHVIQRAEGGYLMSFSTHASFFVDEDLTRMDVYFGPTGTLELVSLLVIGIGLSFVATLDGGLVLHASAVLGPSGLVAFVGPSGTGKTTTAALVARRGHPVVSDDALRVDSYRGRYVGTGAGTELRLRPSATGISDSLGPCDRRTTADGRLAIALSHGHGEERPVTRIYVPRVGGAPPGGVVARHASAQEGAVQLLRALRVGTWLDPELLGQQTRSVAALARSVPVYFLEMPRELSADDAFAVSIAKTVGLE